FVVACALRIAFLLQLRWHSPTYFAPEAGDSILYDRLASGAPEPARAYFHSPLYVWWLTALYTLAGRDLTLVRVLQHALGAANAALLTGGTRRFTQSRWAALAAGVLSAGLARSTFLQGQLLVEGVLPILLTGCCWLAIDHAERPSGRRAFFLGVAVGIATLARASCLVWAPTLLACFFVGRFIGWRRSALALSLGVTV